MYERPMALMLFQTRCADPRQSGSIHREMRRMIRWAEGKITDCGFAEHHISGDGFMSTPLQAAAMAVAAGDTLKVMNCAVLAPLHNPLFLAEQIAFLDLTSGGRVHTVLGMGYREAEYQAAERDWLSRGRVLDESISQLIALLRGEAVVFNNYEGCLHHLPDSDLDSILAVGGNSKRAARRAARFDLPFFPALRDPVLEEAYVMACEEAGVEPRYMPPRFAGFILLADDPEKAWKDWGEYMLFDAMSYEAIRNSHRRSTVDCTADSIAALRESGVYKILTPEEGLALYEQGAHITLNPQVGGIPEQASWRSLELFESEMLPHMSLDYRSFRELPA